MNFWRRHRTLYVAVIALFIYCLGSVVCGGILAQFALHPPREISTAANDARIFPARLLRISETPIGIVAAQGASLHATYAEPTMDDNGDTVILLHGVAADRSSMVGFARLLLAHGYRVLLPDSRAQGNSGGAFATYGILEKDDVHRWLDWISARSPGHCIYGLGESMGAAILLQSIGYDQRFCAAVAESPFATFRQISDIRVGQFTHTGPWLGETLARPMIDAALWYAQFRYGIALNAANPIDGIRQSCTPVLLIHGLADNNIPPTSSVALHNGAPNRTVLWLVPNAGHCGASAVDQQQFNRRVLQWFQGHRSVCTSMT